MQISTERSCKINIILISDQYKDKNVYLFLPLPEAVEETEIKLVYNLK